MDNSAKILETLEKISEKLDQVRELMPKPHINFEGYTLPKPLDTDSDADE